MDSTTDKAMDVASFVRLQKELLELEREEEVQQASLLADTEHSLRRAEHAGVRLSSLHVSMNALG